MEFLSPLFQPWRFWWLVTGVITVPVKSVCSIDKETDNTRVDCQILKDHICLLASLCSWCRFVAFICYRCCIAALVLSSAVVFVLLSSSFPRIVYIAAIIATVIVTVPVLGLSFLSFLAPHLLFHRQGWCRPLVVVVRIVAAVVVVVVVVVVIRFSLSLSVFYVVYLCWTLLLFVVCCFCCCCCCCCCCCVQLLLLPLSCCLAVAGFGPT